MTSRTDVTLRPAAPEDRAAILGLLRQSDLPLEGAADGTAEFLVAERNGRIVSSGALERYGPHALLRSVAVAPDERGKGLGSALVEALLAAARREGIETLSLLTMTAESYFQRFGFKAIERRQVPEALAQSKEFRGACPDSAVAMRLDLTPEEGPGISSRPVS